MFWRHINNSEISFHFVFAFVFIFACKQISLSKILYLLISAYSTIYSDSSPNNNNNNSECNNSRKMCNKNSCFIHWQSPKMKIFLRSPQKTSRIFLLFSFCFVLFGACRTQLRLCVCYCCNKRHNSCWTIWISTQIHIHMYDRQTVGQRDRHVWEHNKNLISRILARTVIENFPPLPAHTERFSTKN